MPTDTSSDPTPFQMGPANPQQHLMAIAQFVADAFAGGQYVDEISRKYIRDSHYDWDTSRLIWDDTCLIHHWGVWGYPMRLGPVQLKVAGVGAVATKESYRKRGLMTMAATDSLKAMAANGYDLSILRGRHYVKFGYVRAWNYVTYRLTSDEIPRQDIQYPYEPLGPAHMDAIIALYNKSHEVYSGTAVRPTYRMLEAEDMGVYGWVDGDGRLAGYVRAVSTDDKKTLQCLEAAGDVRQGVAVLAALFELGDYDTLTFFTFPHHHPILRFLRRGACVVENRYFDISGWRVRIVNLHSTLTKLRPVFETRLQESAFAEWHGALHLDAGEQRGTLQIEKGTVQIVDGTPAAHGIQGGAALARLLIGSDEPEEIVEQAAMVCTGQAADLAAVLFPNCHPMMSHWDEY